MIIFNDDKYIILSYITTLYLFSYLYNDTTEDNSSDIELLLHRVLSVIHSINEKNDDFDITVLLDDIMDDTVKQIITLIHSLKVQMIDEESAKQEDNLSGTGNEEIDKYASLIENSKIGSIAKDICANLKDINIDPSSNPEDLMASIFNGSNNIIGNLIEQVGNSLTNKISSGEINQEDLVGDAFKLLGQLNSADTSTSDGGSFMTNLMGNVMSSMGSSMGNIDMSAMQNQMSQSDSKNKTKDRLRKKLSEKRQ